MISKLLNIKSQETKPIGIIDPNGYEKINRVYWEHGFSPCITGRDYKDPVKVLVYERNKQRKEDR